MTSELDRLARELEAAGTAQPPDPGRHADVLERAVQACTTDPAASEMFDLGDLYLDLAMEYQQLGRFDDALAAADAVVATGMRMHPDARCLRAEILMRAGRVAEAEPIWAAVRAATPEDVWVYNNAGLEYADVGEHDTALGWLTDGLRLTLHTGDPELLMKQLADQRQTCLDELRLPADELQREAATFLRAREQAAPWRPPESTPARRANEDPVGPTALAWFPAGDYEQAVWLWPDFAQSDLIATPDGPLPHAQYCRELQLKLVSYSDTGFPTLMVAPIRIAAFTAWCAEEGHHPDTPDSRAEYAAHLTAAGSAEVIPWPPGRNDRCWCGSGRKYKKCCAAPADRTPQQ
ncbi:SEC-C metal-binding domain-containing protein [Mycobacterium sp. NPDC003449]